ncbi:hypothetical protein HPG69_013726, partial [Diceros bicornis minor]
DHTLCYNFTVIPKHRPGQPWCEVLGEVNGNKFLEYHCGSEVKPVGPLGMKVNATDTWKGQSEALRDLMEELKQKLLDVKPPISTTSGVDTTLGKGLSRPKADLFPWGGADPLILQGWMTCPCKANGCTSPSWHFVVCGSGDRTCTVVETLDNDKDLVKSLRNISNGDCRIWFEQFLVHWGKMLETTASPATAPASTQSKAMTITPITWILSVTFSCSLLLGLLGCVL